MVSKSKYPTELSCCKKINFNTLHSAKRISDFVKNLNIAHKLNSDHRICDEDLKLVICFIHDYQGAYMRLKSIKCRKEYREAFKKRHKELCDLCEGIVSELSFNGLESFEVEFQSNTIYITVGDELRNFRFSEPASFIKLYKFIRVTLTACKYKQEVYSILQLYTTISSLCNDFLLNKEESDIQMEGDIAAIEGEGICSTKQYQDNKLIEGSPQYDINETISLLRKMVEDKTPFRLLPTWAKQFVTSLNKITKVTDKGIEPLLSGSSSGSSIILGKRRRVSLPGYIASAFEPCYLTDKNKVTCNNILQLDESYGYASDKKFKVSSSRRRSVAIDQKKPKKRLINIINNSEQDALTIFEKYDTQLLRAYGKKGPDCTYNQGKGPKFIRKCMKEDRNYLYSLDLSNATNTWLTENQKDVKRLVLSLVYEPEECEQLLQMWVSLMKESTEFSFSSRREKRSITFNSGQPMGYLDSFKAFSIAHHIIMLTIMRKYAADTMADDFYCLLGDDIFFAPIKEVNNRDVLDYYIKLVNSVNVECNVNKGYVYNEHIPGKSEYIAEFAKYLITKEYDLTPIPTKLLCYNKYNIIGLIVWLNEHNANGLNLIDLKVILKDLGWSENAFNYIYIKCKLSPISELRDNYYTSILPIDDKIERCNLERLALVATIMAIQSISVCFMSPLIKERNLDNFSMELIRTKRKDIRQISDHIVDLYKEDKVPKNSKLYRCLNKLDEYQFYLKNQLSRFILDEGEIEGISELDLTPLIDKLSCISDDNMDFFISALAVINDNSSLTSYSRQDLQDYIIACKKIMTLQETSFERNWTSKAFRSTDIIDLDDRLIGLNKQINESEIAVSIADLIERNIEFLITGDKPGPVLEDQLIHSSKVKTVEQIDIFDMFL